MSEDDIKGKVVQLLTGGKQEKPKRERKRSATVQVSGARNVVGVGGRDVHINHQVVQRPKIQPSADAISGAQARQIQNLVEQLVDIEEAGRVLGGDRRKLFAKWYRAIKDRYEVPSYRTIRGHQGDEVVAWLARTAELEKGHLPQAGRKRLREIEGRRGQAAGHAG